MQDAEVVSVDTPVPTSSGAGRLPVARGATWLLRGAVGVATLGTFRVTASRGNDAPLQHRVTRASLYRMTFVAGVVLPSLAVWLYFAFLASNQYVSEARFAVRSAQIESSDSDTTKKALGTMETGSTPSLGSQDAYVVAGYIGSHGVIDDLSKTLDLRAIFTRPEADFWARLPDNASAEQLARYWRSMVSAYVDGPSGIVTVKVRAFRPDDAMALAGAITAASETLINAVSARARADSMARAEDEVRDANSKVQAALAALRTFRDKQGYLDPSIQAGLTAQLLGQLMIEKTEVENDVAVAGRLAQSAAPQMKSMQAHLTSVNEQIDQLKAQMTGSAAQTVAASLPEFEGLELQRTFAEKLYTMSQDALERARRKAEQQNVYVSEFVSPSLPEEAEYPQRFSLSIIITLALTIVWGILALIAAAIDDHRY